MPRLSTMLAVCLLFGALHAALAAGDSPGWVVLHRGGIAYCNSLELAQDGKSVALGGQNGAEQTMSVDTLVAMLKRAHPGERRMPTGAGPYFVELLTGERIRAERFEFDGDTLTAEHFYFGKLSWSKRKVKRLVEARALFHAEGSGFSGLRFKNGDRTEGRIRSIKGGSAIVEMAGIGQIPVGDLHMVSSFVFTPRGGGRRKSYFRDERTAEIMFKNGEVLAVELQGTGRGIWKVKPAWLEKALEVPTIFVRSLAFHGNVVYLPDIPPVEQEKVPYLGFVRPWQADRSLLQEPLQIGELSAHRGIAMHTRTILRYKLVGYTDVPLVFRCLLGIDAKVAGVGGNADVRLEIDGKAVFTKTVSGRDGAAPVSFAIPARSRQLAVVADFGERGSVADHVDLLYPGLMKAGP